LSAGGISLYVPRVAKKTIEYPHDGHCYVRDVAVHVHVPEDHDEQLPGVSRLAANVP
jgi:hypothetical protein